MEDRNYVTREQVLAARDARAARQIQWLARYPETALVSCTMNIAGAEKDSPLIRRCFTRLAEKLEMMLRQSVLQREFFFLPTGPECFLAVRGDRLEVKRRCVQAEGSCPAGRLLDADVLHTDGRPVSRAELGYPERGCIVCGKPGKGCAARRLHSYAELREKTEQLMRAFLTETEPSYLADKAVEALIREVHVTPKPGLVDEENNGSHEDMDLPLMEKSARSLRPYFEDCVRIGMETAALEPEETFPLLRKAGLEAEQAMFAATNGVNTHKGAVYLFGILLGACGRQFAPDAIPAIPALLREAGRVAERAVREDFARIQAFGARKTTGEKLYLDYGVTGARGEAADGFPTVEKALQPLADGSVTKEAFLENDNLCRVLLGIIAEGGDTNLIARGGMEKAKRAADAARGLLASGRIDPDAIRELDGEYISKNLSPGGSADLLAVAIFLANL